MLTLDAIVVMENIDVILNDATRELTRKESLYKVSVQHILDRYFSVIYEISGEVEGERKSYILKISTTKRTCENEYDQYVYLGEKGIRSLEPVLHSPKYNYLITKKENLIDFEVYLKKFSAPETLPQDFYRLGELFKEIENKTGQDSLFNKKEYDNYVLPRLARLTVLSSDESELVEARITKLSSQIDNKKTRVCFVSDFALGNFHLTDEGAFVILDMGDAYVGNLYENLSSIFLNIKFGSLHQYFENATNTKRYFDEFVSGCGIQDINEIEFFLYRVRHLINMIRFIDEHQRHNHSASIIKRILSKTSDAILKNKYKSYLLKLCGDSQLLSH